MEAAVLVVLGAIAGAVVVLAAQSRARRRGARPEPEPPAPPLRILRTAPGDPEAVVLAVLRVLLEASAENPDAVAELGGVGAVLTDGYAIVLGLERQSRRLAREIEELLELGDPDAAAQVAKRTRERRELDRRINMLRERLEALRSMTSGRTAR